jgi:hypothetical protein
MPDKDFDKLFRDQFMDAEIQPSADLWGSIADKLEPKKKRSFPLMWVAAASVAVVASVMLFTQSDEKILLRPNAIAMASVSNESSTAAVPVTTVVNTPNEAVTEGTKMPNVTKSVQAIKRSVPKIEVVNANEQKNILASVQPSETNDHLAIKNDIKRVDVKPLEVIEQEKMVTEKQSTQMIAAMPKKDENADYMEPVDDNDNKKGIRNVGDLVNYVVDKVDKREKKLIKFNTDDDDNSSIIGLNIGFLKLNKKNNK